MTRKWTSTGLAQGILAVAAIALAAPAGAGVFDCSNPTLAGLLEDDITISGEVFFNQRVTMRNGGTLTIEPGTQITMCNATAGLFVATGSGLIAEGTASQPIVFSALDPDINWDQILLAIDLLPNSIMRHVILNDGGGNDASEETAALEFEDNFGSPFAMPMVDHVTINRSGSYGFYLQHNENDVTPPSVTNVTINDSANAPILADAGALGGLGGSNSFNNNGVQRIEVGSGINSGIFQHATWQDHGIPYELTEGIYVRTTGLTPDAVRWTLDPGVTLLVRPEKTIVIGSNTDATLLARGTEAKPITITRIDDSSDYWGQLLFAGNTDSVLEHVHISWGGETDSSPDTTGMIRQNDDGTLTISNSSIEFSQSSGFYQFGGDLYLRDSSLSNNLGLGIFSCCESSASLRGNAIVNNLFGAIRNNFPRNSCIDAVGNFWGDAGGPADSDDGDSACGAGDTNAGLGDSVTAGVLYRPWLASLSGEVTNRSQISAEPRFVIADGISEADVTVTLRDLAGNPLAGKMVEVQSTLGTIQQPLALTDANGQTIAIMTSAETGFASISATNLTDDDQVAGSGGLSFWQGPGDTGGLVDPNGTPYARVDLVLERPPFVTGFPVDFTVPMRNTRSTPIDVEVQYGVSGLHIGVPFTPVDTVNRSLDPGETWDALGFFLPTMTGHQCVEALVSFSSGTSKGGSSFRLQKNKNPRSCNDFKPTSLIPTKLGLGGVRKHFRNVDRESRKVKRCLDTNLTFNKGLATSTLYTTRSLPPTVTPPTFSAGGEITSGLAAAMTELSAIGAEISGLITANGETRQKLSWAAQADDQQWVDTQYFYFRQLSLLEGQKLLELAAAIDNYLIEVQAAGIPDELTTPDEQEAYLASLKTVGFEQSDLDYLLDSGWPQADIDQRLADAISVLEETNFRTVSFYGVIRQTRDEVLAEGNRLVSRFGATTNKFAGKGLMPEPELDPVAYDFRLGHDRSTTETVDLVVKPLNIPSNWTYELSDRSITLDAGQIEIVTLTLNPSASNLGGDRVDLAVEGYIGDELLGGILFDYTLPQLIENVDGVFANGFE
ncbi:MAG: Ig-like domain-containing protein [Pseudomonadota bacterium]